MESEKTRDYARKPRLKMPFKNSISVFSFYFTSLLLVLHFLVCTFMSFSTFYSRCSLLFSPSLPYYLFLFSSSFVCLSSPPSPVPLITKSRHRSYRKRCYQAFFLLPNAESPAQREKREMGHLWPYRQYSLASFAGEGAERGDVTRIEGEWKGKACTPHPHPTWAENTIMTDWMYAGKWPQPVYVYHR